ncbi:NAD(P)-dependent oxidoreductase [Pelagibacterium montanilacus]|uniref:NAD(P)-dependent oxidoreductase n=1 Tax=Pelagibacterium montanilacus TaxID=2185280 RepID=UPI001FEB0FBB|nr:NAD(P)-dependent oxidoreductase [Pelagibacterium montanilacus]
MAAMTLLVIGAGYSARAAIARLRSSHPDMAVIVTARTPEARALQAERGFEAHVLTEDGADEGLRAAARSASHLLVSAPPDKAGDPGLAALGEDLADNRTLAWIGYYSTIGVYTRSDGGWIDETAEVAGTNARLARRLEAEAGWRALAHKRDVPLAILRLAGIYGPGRSAFDKLRAGNARRIVKPGQVFNRVHVDDIAGITALAAERRLEGLFNVADGAPAPPQDVITHAAALLGVAPPPEIDFESADLSPMARSFYANNRKLSNAAICTALDYRFIHPDYRAGLAAILERERGAQHDD